MLNGLSAGCMQLWIRSAEPPGEHRYENRNNNYITCIYAELDNIYLYLFNNLIKGLSVITNFALHI